MGLFPLALLVPLAKSRQDWIVVLKSLVIGCAIIAVLAALAIATGVARWDSQLPSHMGVRVLSNLILTCIPEEGFYRGFVQKTLGDYFKNMKMGNLWALIVASLVFAMSHMYWSPNLGVLVFALLAGLFYGGIYLLSGKIESAILCHFLFNLTHMTFFYYHAA
jgi:membrane protease YdiL (CAAX protease family)